MAFARYSALRFEKEELKQEIKNPDDKINQTFKF
jgi:hypothetical protein